ncbi:MAG: hypothetical protein WCI71_10150 [Bacteroidota bacterium]
MTSETSFLYDFTPPLQSGLYEGLLELLLHAPVIAEKIIMASTVFIINSAFRAITDLFQENYLFIPDPLKIFSETDQQKESSALSGGKESCTFVFSLRGAK